MSRPTKTDKKTGSKGKAKGRKSAKAPKVAHDYNQADRKPTNGNPYRPGSAYWASVEALRNLGINKLHAFDSIVPAVKKAMAEAWQSFAAKGGSEAKARVLQNVAVVARKDYGKPLRALGFEVRWDGRERHAGLFRLAK